MHPRTLLRYFSLQHIRHYVKTGMISHTPRGGSRRAMASTTSALVVLTRRIQLQWLLINPPRLMHHRLIRVLFPIRHRTALLMHIHHLF
ncbi:hypothetical protein SAMD00023353_1000280 [Rosellinia necatrix]|uniref:Uncharacterized protein n=1 Tax=Rosellinia necatrix TaxID=77044 RepID=A0A1S8A6J3_ROSNE|nr:hypothetical protein SAMD00023353_1000280 [Rosellinia necatrix]